MLLIAKWYYFQSEKRRINFTEQFQKIFTQCCYLRVTLKDKAKVLSFMLYLINQDLQLHFYNLIHLFGYRHLTEQLNPYFHFCSKVRLPAVSGNCCRSLIQHLSMSLTRQHNAEKHTETILNPSNSSSLAQPTTKPKPYDWNGQSECQPIKLGYANRLFQLPGQSYFQLSNRKTSNKQEMKLSFVTFSSCC